jgi:hypothetical protein
MGRPLKNSNHPLARLRVQLSENNCSPKTREWLAKKTGVPLPTIRDIELDKFQLSFTIATRISIRTGVDAGSLLRGDNPLLDLNGNSVTCHTKFTGLETPDPLKQVRRAIFEAACEVADDKGIALIFQAWMEDFLVHAFTELHLNGKLAEKFAALKNQKLHFSPAYLKIIREGLNLSGAFAPLVKYGLEVDPASVPSHPQARRVHVELR